MMLHNICYCPRFTYMLTLVKRCQGFIKSMFDIRKKSGPILLKFGMEIVLTLKKNI